VREIRSRSNPLYKRLARLMKGRDPDSAASCAADRRQSVMLEGIHLCQEWQRHRGRPALAVVDADVLAARPPWLMALLDGLEASARVAMPASLLASLSPIAGAQGVLFVATLVTPSPPGRIQGDSVWLDRIQDPGNVGTLLRTIAAAGLRQVLLSPGCAQVWSPRVLRAAQGAHFVLDLHEGVDLLPFCETLDIPLLAAALAPDAASLYDLSLVPPCVWVFGNEGQGVDAALLARATQQVMIPQDAVQESLNVAVAAGVCLFEQRRQRS